MRSTQIFAFVALAGPAAAQSYALYFHILMAHPWFVSTFQAFRKLYQYPSSSCHQLRRCVLESCLSYIPCYRRNIELGSSYHRLMAYKSLRCTGLQQCDHRCSRSKCYYWMYNWPVILGHNRGLRRYFNAPHSTVLSKRPPGCLPEGVSPHRPLCI